MAALGLDIGNSAIKLVELSGKAGAARVDTFGLGVNPAGTLESENPQERVNLAQAIKKLLADSKVKSRKVIAALPEGKVFTRVVEMPLLSDAELASAIAWEAEQYIPMPIAEVQLDYQVIRRPKVAEPTAKMQVFLVAAPKLVVGRLVEILTQVGLEPVALETEVLALTRALIKNSVSPTPGASRVEMIINLGSAGSEIFIVEDEAVALTRAVPIGGLALSRVLASDLGLEQAQAEQYKRTYGLDSRQLQGKVRTALTPVVNNLMGEVRKAMQFYFSAHQGKLSRVQLSGGGAYLPQLTAQVAAELGVETVVANPFNGITMDPTQMKRLGGVGAVFGVAVGLALRGLE